MPSSADVEVNVEAHEFKWRQPATTVNFVTQVYANRESGTVTKDKNGLEHVLVHLPDNTRYTADVSTTNGDDGRWSIVITVTPTQTLR